MLTSEKAALAKCDQIYQAHKLKKAQGQNTGPYIDVDFGPRRKSDTERNKFSLYKNGDPPRKGYTEPADIDWLYAQDFVNENVKNAKGKSPKI